jgi:hypothetical protein
MGIGSGFILVSHLDRWQSAMTPCNQIGLPRALKQGFMYPKTAAVTHSNLRRSFIVTLLTVLANGCGSHQPVNQAVFENSSARSSESVPAAIAWRVVLTVSGGFAGASHEIAVDSVSRNASVNDKVSGQQYSPLLTEETRASLTNLVAALPSDSVRLINSQCADCFAYELVITRGEAVQQVQLDSTTLSGSRYEALISQLDSLRSPQTIAPR